MKHFSNIGLLVISVLAVFLLMQAMGGQALIIFKQDQQAVKDSVNTDKIMGQLTATQLRLRRIEGEKAAADSAARQLQQQYANLSEKYAFIQEIYRAAQRNRQLDREQNQRNRELDRQAFNRRYLLMKDMFDSLSSRHESTITWLQQKEHEGRYVDTNQYGIFITYVKGDSARTLPVEIYNQPTVTGVHEEETRRPGLLGGAISRQILGTIENSNPAIVPAKQPFQAAYAHQIRTAPRTRRIRRRPARPTKKLQHLQPTSMHGPRLPLCN